MMLEDYRKEMNVIDDRLLDLLNQRARLVAQIRAFKTGAGVQFRDRDREREIVARALRINTGPLDAQAVTNIFRCILNQTRNLTLRIESRRG